MTTNTIPNWQLIALTPALGDISFPINLSMSVGRQDSNDVVLNTLQISRQHAKFNQVGKNLFIQDLGSSNGTFVNGKRIGTQAVEVQLNDEIAFADLVFVVSQDEAIEQSVIQEDFTAKSETQSPVIVESSNSNPTAASLQEKATETVYKISTTSETITAAPISETASTTLPAQTTSKPTGITDEKVATPSPITASNDKPMNPTTTVTPETTNKKSPLRWIILVIIVLIILGMILKGW